MTTLYMFCAFISLAISVVEGILCERFSNSSGINLPSPFLAVTTASVGNCVHKCQRLYPGCTRAEYFYATVCHTFLIIKNGYELF